MERCVVDEKVNVRNQLHIPNDLSFSILSKLPIKSLKRFGCVRKSWSLLFDNPIFMTMYRNHFLTKDHSYYDDTSVLLHHTICPWGGGFWDETYDLYCVSDERFENRFKLDWPSVKLDPKSEYDSGFNILGSGSVNGTLCLFCVLRKNVILWNPSTEEFKLIPPSPFDCGANWHIFVQHRGFGYDRVRDDYKVLCYGEKHYDVQSIEDIPSDSYIGELIPDYDVQSREDIPSDSYIWEIYSLRSNSWRKLDVNMDYMPSNFREEEVEVYMDGFSHWTCTSATPNDIYMLSIDWCNEIFLTTPIPSYIDDDIRSSWPCLTLLNGSIALIFYFRETGRFHISILGELGVKESWTKIFIVGTFPGFYQPIGAGKKGTMLLRNVDVRVFLFDLNTQMIEELDVIPDRYHCKIVIHKENLLPFPFDGADI